MAPRRHEVHLTADLAEHDLRVLTLHDWANLNSISFKTAKRLLAKGKGPRTIQISANRVGIRMVDNRKWQEARVR